MKLDEKYVLNFLEKNPRASLQDLADDIGITRQAVSSNLKRNNINWKELREEAKKEQIERYLINNPNVTIKKMAKDLKADTQTLRSEMKKYGLFRQRTTTSAKSKIKREELESYILKHPEKNIRELAEYFKVCYLTMFNTLRRYDIKLKTNNELVEELLNEDKIEKYLEEHPDSNQIEMADFFGVSKYVMSEYIIKHNINIPGKNTRHKYSLKITKKEIESFLEKHPEANQEDMTEFFGVSRNTIRRCIRRYDIIVKGKGTRRDKKRTEEGDILKAIDMLETINGLTITRLREFLEEKGIQISENDILEYQKRKIDEKEEER